MPEFEDVRNVADRVYKYIPESAPMNEVIRAIYEVANEVEESGILLDDIQAVDVTQGVDYYDISPFSNTEHFRAIGVAYASYKDVEMKKTPMMMLDRVDVNWRNADESPPSRYYINRAMSTGNSIRMMLNRKPDETLTGALDVIATLASIPSATGTESLTTFYKNYNEIIEFGTAGRIMMQPNKKWTDFKTGKYYLVKFNHLKQEIFSKHLKGYTSQSVGVNLIRWV